MSDALLERLSSEVTSRCASLRSASRLLGKLSAEETDEILALMTDEAFRLARALESRGPCKRGAGDG